MKIRIADFEDYKQVIDFYHEVIDRQSEDEYSPRWTKGIYPTDEDLKNHLENNELYVGISNDKVACCGVLTIGEDEIYKDVDWKEKDSVAVIHLLAVHPDFRGQGLSVKLVDTLIEECRDKVKAIHLDVMKGNLRANRLYEKCGFQYLETKGIFYEDTGMCEADLYEYLF